MFSKLSSIYFDQRGQGLLETVVALGIIVSGLVGAVTLAVSNQTASEDAAERLVAAGLAREGIEVVRNIRDSNWLTCTVASCNAWDAGTSGGTSADTTAVPVFDPVANSWSLLFAPDSITADAAKIWRMTGTHAGVLAQAASQPDGSSTTLYTRLLTIRAVCEDASDNRTTAAGTACGAGLEKVGLRVESQVAWSARGKETSLTAEEWLYNWR